MRRSVLLLVLLAAVTFFAGLGRPAIGDSDEGFYAEAGREMVEGGDWLTPHYNYEFRFQKPILFYWLVSASYVVGGVGETQRRVLRGFGGIGRLRRGFGSRKQTGPSIIHPSRKSASRRTEHM